MSVEKREKPTLRGDDAKRFLKNKLVASMTEQAKIDAAVRAERERIAGLLGNLDSCPPDWEKECLQPLSGTRKGPRSQCPTHWLKYLEPK
jgi:hypothetical protein